MLKRLLVSATLFLSATGASAAVLLSLDAPPTESAGIWTYHYTATLEPLATLRAPDPSIPRVGDFFTLYDFVGLQGPVTSANFVPLPNIPVGGPFSFDVESANLGRNPPDFPASLLVDDPSIPNVTVLLTGTKNIVPSGTSVTLGTLTLSSTDSTLGSLQFASEYQQGGRGAANRSFVSLPIPEPSTYAFMGLGLLVAALAFRARK
jgi:hypothetical protein